MKNDPIKRKRMGKAIRIALAACAVLFVLACVLVGTILTDAPKLDEVSARPDGYLTTVLDDDENTMLTLAGVEANRIYVSIDSIPENLQNAVIAIEDSRFYSHHGVDLKGVARAAVKGILKGFHFSEGASTITQQLVKNNVLAEEWEAESSFYDRICRKIQEQYLALKLEKMVSKEWILENYLNTINLGSGTWGVEAASRHYFGKDVSELTLSECAVLAAIPKSPTAYNPILHPEASRERQQLVLADMLEQGMITQSEYDEAIADDVYSRIAGGNDSGTAVFSYFEDALLTSVAEDLMEQYGYDEEKAWDLIYRGGLTIYSTQDSEIQEICEQVVNDDSCYADEDVQCSVVITSVATGAVKAMVGGRGEKTASLTYNRATDSLRQPGSLLKIPGEYAAGLDTGTITLGTTVDDCETTYSDGTQIRNASGSYNGQTTVRRAIAASINTVAYKVFRQVGMDTVWSYLQKFGFSSLTEADRVEALALGGTSGGVTNLEVAAAYNAIAADGVYVEPYYYTQVLSHDGSVLLAHASSGTQVISASTAELLTSAMEDVLTSGTGTAAAFSGYPQAGKSGTTTGYKDVWFAGYSPYFTCSVWGGYDSPAEQSGNAYVKKIWKSIMQQTHDNYIYRNFPDEGQLQTAKICTKCGKLAIEGLCDSTVAGNASRTEYFAAGTQPREYCTCHEAVTVCTVSGQLAGNYCPEETTETRVYLKTATEGTSDENYLIPSDLMLTCSQHTSIWDRWFGSDSEEAESSGEENGEDSGSSGGGRHSIWETFGW